MVKFSLLHLSFLPYKEKLPGGSEDADFVSAKFDPTHVRKNIGLWKGDVDDLKPCWVKPSVGKILFEDSQIVEERISCIYY